MRFILLSALTSLLLLAGCGQKGTLYIPKDDARELTVSSIKTRS